MPLLLLLQLYFSPFFVQVQDAENARSQKKNGDEMSTFCQSCKIRWPTQLNNSLRGTKADRLEK
jgi:hypothetical protein